MQLPREMTEVQIVEPGGPEVLRAARVPVPLPQPGEVLVRVAAAGVNRPDILQRQGRYPAPADALPGPGLEVAGTVVQVGEAVHGIAAGERVCALTNGGGYAEFCRVPYGQVLPWPDGLDATEAAALPETFFTVWANLFMDGRLRAGQSVLVHGGTSGIGTTALMLLREFDLRGLATAGTEAKCAALVELGAELAVNYRTTDFAEAVRQHTGGRGVDAILDIVGADYFQRNLACLAMDGRLVLLAFLGGATVREFDLRPVLARRLVITGSTLRPRTPAEKAAIAEDLRREVWPRIVAGRLRPRIHATFRLERAADAHRMLEAGEHIGKIVLVVRT